MNCSRFETLLTDYMERTLEAPVADAVRSHLEGCRSCQALYGDVLQVRERLESFPAVRPPLDLVNRILDRTSGRPMRRSWWRDLVLPTLRPFMTQRYAFATLMLFVFLSLMVNLVGPPAGAVLSPARLAESADRFSSQVSKSWAELRDTQSRILNEMSLLAEDLYGRLDYHLISMLFKSYSQSIDEKKGEDSAAQPEPAPPAAETPGR